MVQQISLRVTSYCNKTAISLTNQTAGSSCQVTGVTDRLVIGRHSHEYSNGSRAAH